MSTDASQSPEDPAERALLDALRQRGDADAPDSEADDELLIAAVVDAHLAAAAPGKTRGRLAPWIAATGLLAAAAAAALWLIPDSTIESPGETTTVGVAQPTNPAPTQAMWVLESDGSEPRGVTVASAREACGVRAKTRACLMPGSRGTFAPDGNLQLHEGSARVEAGEPIILFLPDVRVEAATDTASFVATRRGQQWMVVVDSGTVTLTGPDGSTQVLEAGESSGSEPTELAATADAAHASKHGDTADTTDGPEHPSKAADDPSAEPKPPPSADELLALARSQRASRNFAAAAQSYERLIQAHPNSAKVRATLVSLAQLYQGPLDDPAKALDYFDRYLERGGPLAEDAHYGKIRALRSLGRSAAAATEVEAFLAAYPDSPHALKLESGE